jgi:hypothetical protein
MAIEVKSVWAVWSDMSGFIGVRDTEAAAQEWADDLAESWMGVEKAIIIPCETRLFTPDPEE